MTWKLIQLDLFRTSAYIQNSNGECKKYFIELVNGYYICFVQRKSKRKWSNPSVVDKSKNILLLDYYNNEIGLKIEEIF